MFFLRRIDRDESQRWRGTTSERIVAIDRQLSKMESTLSEVKTDIKDILKWRYIIVGSVAVLTLIVSAFNNFLINYLTKKF